MFLFWLPWPSNCCTQCSLCVSFFHSGRGSETLYLVSLLSLLTLDVTSFFVAHIAYKSFDKSSSIPDMWHLFHLHLCLMVAIQNAWIYNTHFQTPERAFSPPLQRFPNESICYAVMITAIYTTYMLRIVKNTHWLLNFFLLPPFLNGQFFFHWCVMICRHHENCHRLSSPLAGHSQVCRQKCPHI
jgi:hypothetical protein